MFDCMDSLPLLALRYWMNVDDRQFEPNRGLSTATQFTDYCGFYQCLK